MNKWLPAVQPLSVSWHVFPVIVKYDGMFFPVIVKYDYMALVVVPRTPSVALVVDSSLVSSGHRWIAASLYKQA